MVDCEDLRTGYVRIYDTKDTDEVFLVSSQQQTQTQDSPPKQPTKPLRKKMTPKKKKKPT